MGGDNVNRASQRERTKAIAGRSLLHADIPTTAIGIFYEGAVTQGYSTDAADAALQMDVVAAGYGQ